MDPIAEWTDGQRRVAALVTDATDAQAATMVPACPEWTVRDLLSHMIGLTADVVAGNEPDDHNAVWTKAQVDSRRERDVPALLAEWHDLVEPMRTWLRDNGSRPLNDLLIHEQDLRGALGVSGAQDTPGLNAVRERFVGRFAARLGDLSPIELLGDSWEWSSADDAVVVLRASDFELTRALMARRSAAQLVRWTVRGDVTPYLRAFATLGDLPTRDLSE